MRKQPTFGSLAENVKLAHFVEWRQALWAPPVEHLIGDPRRFAGKTVLDIGCRHGRMSCFFGLLGATVLGVDLPGVPLEPARSEAKRWRVEERVSFVTCDGNPENIPGNNFDYVFTKSVLVMIPDLEMFLRGIRSKLREDGELLAAENLAGGHLLSLGRRLWTYRRYRGLQERFKGVDSQFVAIVNRVFKTVDVKKYRGTVAAIRARVAEGEGPRALDGAYLAMARRAYADPFSDRARGPQRRGP